MRHESVFGDRTVLITGASSGIGQALARRFGHEGARLVLVARRAERLEPLAREIGASGASVTIIPADLDEASACERVVEEARRRAGRIDVLVNNAGVGEYGRFAEQEWTALDAMMRLNMTALVRLTKLVLPEMLDRRSGHIVNLASTAAFQPTAYMAVYGATKSFVLDFSLALWEEVRRKGVRVTCICPGPVRTEFFDHGGFQSQRTRFMRTALDPDRLAGAAFRRIARGRVVYVPGILNKLGAFLVRFGSLKTVTRVTAKLLGSGR